VIRRFRGYSYNPATGAATIHDFVVEVVEIDGDAALIDLGRGRMWVNAKDLF